MLRILVITLVTSLSLLIVDILFPGVYISSFTTAIIAALVIGLINAFIKPFMSFLSLPINVLTLGVFSSVINVICFWIAAILVPGFVVHGLFSFIFAPLVLSTANTFLIRYLVERSRNIEEKSRI